MTDKTVSCEEVLTKEKAEGLLRLLGSMGGDNRAEGEKKALEAFLGALGRNVRLLEALELCGAYAHIADITEIEAVVQKALDGEPQYNPLKAQVGQLVSWLRIALGYDKPDVTKPDMSLSEMMAEQQRFADEIRKAKAFIDAAMHQRDGQLGLADEFDKTAGYPGLEDPEGESDGLTSYNVTPEGLEEVPLHLQVGFDIRSQ